MNMREESMQQNVERVGSIHQAILHPTTTANIGLLMIKGTPYDLAIEGVGQVTEFCVGGPDSNQRSKAHMERLKKTFLSSRMTMRMNLWHW